MYTIVTRFTTIYIFKYYCESNDSCMRILLNITDNGYELGFDELWRIY